MRERFGDSCGLLISSNSLELLLKIGILDFLSPCLVWFDLVSGEINLDNILGGFISEILGVLCSWLFAVFVSSCSSAFVLLFVVTVERSVFFAFMASDDGTSSSCLNSFSWRFGFVRSLISPRGADFSYGNTSFLATSLHESSFAEPLRSIFDLLARLLANWFLLIAVRCFPVDGFYDFVLVDDFSVLLTTGR